MAPATKRAARTTTPTNPDLVPIDSDVEVWRNCSAGMTYITRIGEYGKHMTDLIHGGRTFSLTPTERRLNQHSYATVELDLFTNGTFQPVSLVDGEPDTSKLLDNPNTLSDADIQKLLAIRGEAFEQRINAITSENTLTRILNMARQPRYEVTLAQYETLKLRNMAIKGEADDEAPRPEVDPNTGAVPRAVTPR
jgi:hypothetical protein